MAALAWLLIPLVAAVAASLWGSWVGRRRAKTPDAAGVAGYERFRAAMERGSSDSAATDAELASAGASARATPDGPAREAG
ncbi:hypothetical protein ACQEU8_12350 [Streptomyces sp. CA-250714]|uniref:hypothetical protein n=1 Tax=Streptomyces sp. CA-250714 TaxID=3240060 RepID=UPI003D8B8C45